MKVLALIERPQHVCYRYRIEAYASALFERGPAPGNRPPSPGWHRLASFSLPAIAAADIVILQRKLLPRYQLQLVRRFAKKTRLRHGRRRLPTRQLPAKRTQELPPRATLPSYRSCGADAVIVGNEYLRRCAAQIDGGKKIHVVPTTVQPQYYRPTTTSPGRCQRSTRMDRLEEARSPDSNWQNGNSGRLRSVSVASTCDSCATAASNCPASTSCFAHGPRRPRRPNWPMPISVSVGSPTTPGAVESAASRSSSTWRPGYPSSPTELE